MMAVAEIIKFLLKILIWGFIILFVIDLGVVLIHLENTVGISNAISNEPEFFALLVKGAATAAWTTFVFILALPFNIFGVL